MYFDSLQALLEMEGHGGFVWSAYLVTIVVIIGLIAVPIRRRKAILKQLAGELRRAGIQSITTGDDV